MLNAKLAAIGLAVSVPLGFNNSYALAIRADNATRRGISRLSDLKQFPDLRLGLSQEFIGRADGWPGLKRSYALPFDSLRGLDHGLAYDAVAQGQVDVIDIYSTDAKIGKYQMTVLTDDLQYFPRYDAVLLYKADLPTRLPRTFAAIMALEGRISDQAMRRMNAAAELDKQSFAQVAGDFLAAKAHSTATADLSVKALPGETKYPAKAATNTSGFWQKLFGPDFARLAAEHLALVFLSLIASIAVGVPLGIFAARHPSAEAMAVLHVRLHLPDRLVCVAARSKAETRFRERRVEYRREHLGYGLLDHPVHDRGDSQHPFAAIGLGDFHCYNQKFQ